MRIRKRMSRKQQQRQESGDTRIASGQQEDRLLSSWDVDHKSGKKQGQALASSMQWQDALCDVVAAEDEGIGEPRTPPLSQPPALSRFHQQEAKEDHYHRHRRLHDDEQPKLLPCLCCHKEKKMKKIKKEKRLEQDVNEDDEEDDDNKEARVSKMARKRRKLTAGKMQHPHHHRQQQQQQEQQHQERDQRRNEVVLPVAIVRNPTSSNTAEAFQASRENHSSRQKRSSALVATPRAAATNFVRNEYASGTKTRTETTMAGDANTPSPLQMEDIKHMCPLLRAVHTVISEAGNGGLTAREAAETILSKGLLYEDDIPRTVKMAKAMRDSPYLVEIGKAGKFVLWSSFLQHQSNATRATTPAPSPSPSPSPSPPTTVTTPAATTTAVATTSTVNPTTELPKKTRRRRKAAGSSSGSGVSQVVLPGESKMMLNGTHSPFDVVTAAAAVALIAVKEEKERTSTSTVIDEKEVAWGQGILKNIDLNLAPPEDDD